MSDHPLAPSSDKPERAPEKTSDSTSERAASGSRRVPRPALRARARAGGSGDRERRTGRAFTVSVGLHLLVGVVVVQLLTFGHGLYRFLDPFAATTEVQEGLTYVEPKASAPVVPPAAATRPAPRAPVSTGPVVGPVIAAPMATVPADTGSGGGAPASAPAAGSGIGAIDPNLRGTRPGYTDGRVWAGPGAGPAGPGPARSGAERLDSVMAAVLTQAADSVDSIARATGAYGRAPGDWTKRDKNGNKWGWDNAGIRLGKVTIPNALLSLLPMNAQAGMSANPTTLDRERRLSMAREDIQRFSSMGPGDAEFNKLNKELRDRRERERRGRLRAPSAANVAAPQKGGANK
ncbi:MAG TPA: hypothetical protein VE869_08990 [Gemmatimonas sp.]|nr:hypothetical protein [Gemmatimonas sp.]